MSIEPVLAEDEGSLPAALFTVSRVVEVDNGKQIGTASGFFFRSKSNRSYFATNKHVVKPPQLSGRSCTEIVLNLHVSNTDLTKNKEVRLALLDKDGKSLFFEHPNNIVDVVLIPISDPPIPDALIRFINPDWFFSNTEFAVGIGEDSVVVGYPLGASDVANNLPIFRHATIASMYGVDFGGVPFCVIDANLQPGMSGSPIFTKPLHTRINRKGKFQLSTSGLNNYGLLGLLSRKLPVSVNGVDQEIGLNNCWYPTVLNDIADLAERK